MAPATHRPQNQTAGRRRGQNVRIEKRQPPFIRRTGAWDYLRTAADALHTTGTPYTVDEIDRYITAHPATVSSLPGVAEVRREESTFSATFL